MLAVMLGLLVDWFEKDDDDYWSVSSLEYVRLTKLKWYVEREEELVVEGRRGAYKGWIRASAPAWTGAGRQDPFTVR